MAVITKVSQTRHTGRALFVLVALAFASAGLCCSDLSAGLLDKLKKHLNDSDQQEQTLDSEEVGSGLKEALQIGTENAVHLTSAEDGFLGNELIRIPLPESLDPMADALRSVGRDAQGR